MIPGLTETTIAQQTTPEVYERGRDYFDSGAVISLVRRGDTIQARVEGSAFDPYHVQIEVDEGGIVYAACTCPYNWGDWCKHIVAAALAYLHHSGAVEERPPVEEAIEALDPAQLVDLLRRLAARGPAITEAIEEEIGRLEGPTPTRAAPQSPPPPRRTTVNQAGYRRRMRDILHSLDNMRASEAYWHVAGVIGSVRELVEEAERFLAGGDAYSALIILGTIADEYVRHWTYLDGSSGETGEFFYELGTALAEALLAADLSEAERAQWRQNIQVWDAEAADYGVDAAFEPALAALDLSPDDLLADRAVPAHLVPMLLNVLHRRGEHARFLQLSDEAGELRRHALMLAQLGRVDDAVAYALARFQTAEDAFALALALREQKALDAALHIGEHGLALAGHRAALAAWVRDLATGLDRRDLALRAATVACQEMPDLQAYRAVRELAGESWSSVRETLLAHLRREGWADGSVEIFLHEGLINDAIAKVESHASFETLARVVEAAATTRPDWAIRRALQQAAAIIQPGKSQHYHHAVEWLRRARDAYRAAGREDEWQAHLRQLRAEHGRKYKLMDMLQQLT